MRPQTSLQFFLFEDIGCSSIQPGAFWLLQPSSRIRASSQIPDQPVARLATAVSGGSTPRIGRSRAVLPGIVLDAFRENVSAYRSHPLLVSCRPIRRASQQLRVPLRKSALLAILLRRPVRFEQLLFIDMRNSGVANRYDYSGIDDGWVHASPVLLLLQGAVETGPCFLVWRVSANPTAESWNRSLIGVDCCEHLALLIGQHHGWRVSKSNRTSRLTLHLFLSATGIILCTRYVVPKLW